MSHDPSSESNPRQKANEALRRAVPLSRMLDYGVPERDAMAWTQAITASPEQEWSQAAEPLATRRQTQALAAQQRDDRVGARTAWLARAALLQCAQLGFHQDEPRKRELYEAAWDAFRQAMALEPHARELTVSVPGGFMHGWGVLPDAKPEGAVVLVGGLSGWGSVYYRMAQTLVERGIATILAEGPGQGLTRLRHGITLTEARLDLFTQFLDEAQALGARHLGVWGNSFGGLFAAHMAVRDARVAAVCINGAPMRPVVPEFRTAQAQMAALTGRHRPQDLSEAISALGLDPAHHRTDAAMLVLEGGADPLVPAGSQSEFFQLTSNPVKDLMQWEDGEHTIYNHAADRNARVADWFAQQLRACGA